MWSAGIEPAVSSLARTRRKPVDHDHMDIGETGGSRTHGVACTNQVHNLAPSASRPLPPSTGGAGRSRTYTCPLKRRRLTSELRTQI